MRFDPPRYEWTADNVEDALTALEAATSLIRSHMNSLDPEAGYKPSVRRTAPAHIHITLDLGDLVQAINDQHTLDTLDATLDPAALD